MSQLAGIGPSSAIVTIDPKNGDILTMASTQTYGRSKGKSTYNLATQGKRQPGSRSRRWRCSPRCARA